MGLLLFVPLTTATMDPIPKEEMGNATSMFNLMRNIGGSIGISVVNTIVARHEQLHRSELRRRWLRVAPRFKEPLGGMQQYLSAQGASSTTSLRQSYGLLNLALDGQAHLWSYVDDFRYIALVCFGCVPIVFALKKAVGKKGAVGAGH